jgi:hypothetical protein
VKAFMPKLTMKIVKKAHLSEGGAGIMTVVIMRPYTHLEKELNNAFKGQENVKVILDRRYGERRKRSQAVAKERRMAGRRRLNEELVEVVFPT